MTPEQLVNKWSHVLEQGRHIPTWTEPASLAYCAELASHADTAVEIGTYMGASAFVMLRANPRLRLWCVDTFTVFGVREIASMFLKQEIESGRCELLQTTSDQAAIKLAGRSLDIVWVDDGHATEDVLRDIRSFWPLVRSGGIMFGHDFDIPMNDVAQGVLKSGIPFSLPVPRVWMAVKYATRP